MDLCACRLIGVLVVVGFNCVVAHTATHSPSQRAAITALPVDLVGPLDFTFKE